MLGLSPEVTYALKRNVAYPIVGATASALEALAETRIEDAFTASTGDQTQSISDITVATLPVVNQ